LHDAVDAVHHVLDGVFAATVVGTSGRIGGSNMGKMGRMKEKWRKDKHSESAYVHYPSSHNAPLNQLRLDDD
jgi:hypothetical protein